MSCLRPPFRLISFLARGEPEVELRGKGGQLFPAEEAAQNDEAEGLEPGQLVRGEGHGPASVQRRKLSSSTLRPLTTITTSPSPWRSTAPWRAAAAAIAPEGSVRSPCSA